MRLIQEKNGYCGVEYGISINDKLVQKVNIQRVSLENKAKHYVFLIDSKGRIIESVFSFLNDTEEKDTYANNALNSKEQVASALKYLYSFKEIINKDFTSFTTNDVEVLSDFILGHSKEGLHERWELNTDRSITTHELYFSAIRQYLKFIKIANKSFFSTKVVAVENAGFGMMAHAKAKKIEKYNTSLTRDTSFSRFVPKYIGIEDFKKLTKVNAQLFPKTNLRNQIIMELMFTKGLRIGEVMGLTREDIKKYPLYENAGKIILRNRLSDKKYQHAKNLMIPESREEYKSRLYKEGAVELIISPNLYEKIMEYMEDSVDIFNVSEIVYENILNQTKADSVELNNENYYLFFNKNGTPLTATGWGKLLKKLYYAAGIKIDIGTKLNNLSHRFRHGYAMYLIDNEEKEIHEVKEKMRHKSISSTLIYYNPKEEDILEEEMKIQKRTQEILYGNDENNV